MSNEQAIDVLNMIKTHGSLPTQAKAKAIQALKNERPEGYWIITHRDYIKCSKCDSTIHRSIFGDYSYCPYCGAKMIGIKKEER